MIAPLFSSHCSAQSARLMNDRVSTSCVCVCVFVCLALISRLSIQRIRIRIHLSANAVQVSSCILAEALPGAKFAPPNAGSHGLHLHALKRSILIILNHSLIQTLQRCCPITATSTVINREERRH